MKPRHHALLIGTLTALIQAGSFAQADPPDAQAIIDERISANLAPAIAVGIVRKDGSREMFFAGTLHSGGDTAVDENTIFEIGSISKAFTGILLARMVEKGELSLSDTATMHLPPEVTLSEDITLMHLATHTSGLPRMPDNFAPKDPANPYADYTVRQMYDFLSETDAGTTVGGNPAYSNLGTGLLGHILERRSGKDYETLMIERIAEPLDMNSTTTRPRPENVDRVAGAHAAMTPVSAWDIPTFAGAGDINSTLKDMLVFTAANLGQLETDLNESMMNSHAPRVKPMGSLTKLGLAWHVTGETGREITWHNGGTGGFASFMGFRPDTSEGVVVLSNGNYRGVDRIGFHLLDADRPLDSIRKPFDIDPSILPDYVGSYTLAPGAMVHITLDDDQLFAGATGESPNPLFPINNDEFSFRVADVRITFMRNDDDQVDRLVLHQDNRDVIGLKSKHPVP